MFTTSKWLVWIHVFIAKNVELFILLVFKFHLFRSQMPEQNSEDRRKFLTTATAGIIGGAAAINSIEADAQDGKEAAVETKTDAAKMDAADDGREFGWFIDLSLIHI